MFLKILFYTLSFSQKNVDFINIHEANQNNNCACVQSWREIRRNILAHRFGLPKKRIHKNDILGLFNFKNVRRKVKTHQRLCKITLTKKPKSQRQILWRQVCRLSNVNFFASFFSFTSRTKKVDTSIILFHQFFPNLFSLLLSKSKNYISNIVCMLFVHIKAVYIVGRSVYDLCSIIYLDNKHVKISLINLSLFYFELNFSNTF